MHYKNDNNAPYQDRQRQDYKTPLKKKHALIFMKLHVQRSFHDSAFTKSAWVLNPNITIDIYFTRHNPCLLRYIPVSIQVAVDAYSEPWVSRCTSPCGLQDINALENGFSQNLVLFCFF